MGKRDKLRNLTKEEREEIIMEYELNILEDIKIDDNETHVTCRICGEQCKRVYGHHLKKCHNGIPTKEYRELFNDAPTYSLSHSKSISDKKKGENNPMHKSNTTDEFRKSISPFSIEFYNKRYPEKTLEERQEMLNEFAKRAAENTIGTTNIDYYLNQGMSQEEAEIALSERQKTFSKDICIEKYGEKEGMEVWMDRQEKWIDSLNKGGRLKNGYSEISQQLFREIENEMNETHFIYGEKNGGEFKVKGDCKTKWYMFDFTDHNRKKIIEYNGDRYHGNPNIFEANDCPHPFRKEIKAKDMWENDKLKLESVENLGYEVLIIWESDYNKKTGIETNKKVVNKCIDFLLERGEFDKNNVTMNDTFN